MAVKFKVTEKKNTYAFSSRSRYNIYLYDKDFIGKFVIALERGAEELLDPFSVNTEQAKDFIEISRLADKLKLLVCKSFSINSSSFGMHGKGCSCGE